VSSTLTAALQAYLAADATLTAAAVGGVWLDPAPQNAVVAQASDVATVRTAAERLNTLLDYAAMLSSLTGFLVLGNRNTSPIDETYEDITGRWVRVGGEYTLFAEDA
jgi:hypothetical protein